LLSEGGCHDGQMTASKGQGQEQLALLGNRDFTESGNSGGNVGKCRLRPSLE
jgi:hypothetical protein